jgi:photosystem II stability/assembly factor-like uncharacterized protein
MVGDQLLTRTSDGGRSWTPLAGGTARFDDVRIDDNGNAVAVGSAGTIAHVSADGHVALQQFGSADLHTIHIGADEDGDRATGFAAGAGGQVWVTLDAGETWREGPNVGRTVLGLDQIGSLHR